MAKLCFAVAFHIWRTDERFEQSPFGPPDRWFWPRIAWELYHLALWIDGRKSNG